jgi:hypothetical protein
MNDTIENQKITNQSWSTNLEFRTGDLELIKLPALLTLRQASQTTVFAASKYL